MATSKKEISRKKKLANLIVTKMQIFTIALKETYQKEILSIKRLNVID